MKIAQQLNVKELHRVCGLDTRSNGVVGKVGIVLDVSTRFN